MTTCRPSRATSRFLTWLVALGAVLASGAAPSRAASGTDPDWALLLLSSDDALRAQGMDYSLQQIELLGKDGSHATVRQRKQEYRWVRGDGRRGDPGVELTFLVDDAGHDAEPSAQTLEDAIARNLLTWSEDSCLSRIVLRTAPDPGGDVTIFDYLVGTGGFGDPFAADVVVAGPAVGMEEVLGDDILAFSVTFVFVDTDGVATDVDGDGYLDTAHSEIYLNPTVDWTTGGTGAGIDLETVLLHETGHSLGLGHFGPPPKSVMTSVYSGVRRTLFPIDHAALCAVYRRKK